MKNLYHFLLCAVLAMMSSATWAQTFTVGDLSFTVTDADAKTVSVNKTDATTGEVVIPSSVTNEEVTYTVTSIPGSAFASTDITSITIPASVLSVGSQAFHSCNSLTAITIEDSETPLAWNGNYYQPLWLDANYTLYLGRDLTTEDNRCYFAGATSVVIGPKVTTINDNLFDGASKLASVTMGNGVTAIGAYAFQNTGTDNSVEVQTISLGANVETIGQYAFNGCSKLTSLDLGKKLTAIPNDMLRGCTALTAITIPASVLSVGATAFCYCNALTAITIEDSETPLAWNGNYYHPLYIDSNYTLYLGRDLTTEDNRCYFGGATSVVIGDKVTTINNNLFEGATKLAGVTMGNGVTAIGAYAFQNTGSDESVKSQSISLGANVETIGDRAFYGCSKLTTLDLGTKLKAIPNDMLVNCSAITSLTIPASVMSVGTTAFNNCDALTSIIIEDSETPLAWNGGYYQPLWNVNSNYTLYLGRDLTTAADQCYFWGATNVVIGDNVTSINPYLFYQAPSLASVTMGSGVTTIGASAFQDSGTGDGVESQSISLGVNVDSIGSYAFSGCTKLTSLDFGTKLKAIPEYMLASCTSLTSLTIPASIESVATHAFDNCDGLTAITIQDSETPLAWNGGYYQPLWNADANYTLYLGRDLKTDDYRCYFGGATSVEFGPNVTTINQSLFYGASNLASATIGSGVTTIGDQAFLGCSKLTSVNICDGVTRIGADAFNSSGLTSVTIPASVMTIGNQAFNFINSLESVTIEDSETPLTLENNYYGAFQNGDGGGINYYTRTIYIGRDIINNRARTEFDTAVDVIIGPKVTTINESMFHGCQHLRSVVIGDGVTSIGNNAFYNCGTFVGGEGNEEATVDKLTVTIGKNVKTIGDGAFLYCSKLTSIEIPNGVTRIGADAFNSSGLTSVTIPASVETIGNQAFNFINALESVTIADGDTPLTLENTYYGAFQNGDAGGTHYTKTVYLGRDINNFNNRERTDFDTMEELTIGPKVTTLRPYMFAGCYGLQSVDMTNATGLTSIGNYAFYNCNNEALTRIDLSNTKVTSYGNRAFYDCSYLTEVVPPATLQTIGDDAFYYCSNLDKVTIPASVTTIGNEVFYYTDKMTSFTIEDSETTLQCGTIGDGFAGEDFYLGRNVEYTSSASGQIIFTNVKNVTIGPNVTTIKPYMFARGQLVSVKPHALTPLAINDYDFDSNSYTNATLLVPAGTTEAYAAADGWKNFTNVDYWSTLVTLTASAHGSIVTAEATASNGSEQFHQPKNDDVVYTLNADNGYELTALTDNDVAVSPLPELGAEQTRANSEGEEFVTLAATFTPITYTITYELAGGSAADGSPVNYTIESETFTLVNPTRNGYTFSGWTGTGLSAATKTVTIAKGSMENRSYTATWTPIDYAINYDLADGSVESANRTSYNIETTTFTLNNPTREGYTFAGWTGTGLSAATKTVTIAKGSTGERSYTATWTPITYNITLTLNGGEADNPATYSIETATFDLTNPTKNGYEFAGWKQDGTGDAQMTVTFAKGSTGNKAYTATWTPVTYTISYNLDGGTAADGSPTTYTIESNPVTLLAPTKVGHIFAGWTGTDVAAATLSVTIPTGSTGNRSYTATWEKATFTVTIEGDAQADNTQPKYGDNVTITIAKDEDRTLTALTVDGVNVISGIDEDADSYTYVIRNISADVTVVATFVSTKEFITMDDTYATFSCTQDLDFSGVSGLKAYIASGYSKNSGDVLLTRVESAPAGTGLILVGEKGVTYKVPYAESDALYMNFLTPVSVTKVIPQEEGGNTNFLLERRNGSFGFYKSDGNTTLGAGKSYLQVPSSAVSSDVKMLEINFGDILVPVQGLKAGAEAPDGVYDLNGRKIPAGHKLTRGVYIVNGKKIAIK